MRKGFFILIALLKIFVCSTLNEVSHAKNISSMMQNFSLEGKSLQESFSILRNMYNIDLQIKGNIPKININTNIVNATAEYALKAIISSAGISNSLIIIDKEHNVIFVRILDQSNETRISKGEIENKSEKLHFGPLTREQKSQLKDIVNIETEEDAGFKKLTFEQNELLEKTYRSQIELLEEGELSDEQKLKLEKLYTAEDYSINSSILSTQQIEKLKKIYKEDEIKDDLLTQEQSTRLKMLYIDDE